jgi:hypothetical protein
MQRLPTSRLAALGALCCFCSLGQTPAQADQPILPNLPANPLNVSTVPPNGDVNPYGVAFVPQGFPLGGPLHPGDILVSNFNDSNNIQGTGTTIVKVTPGGIASVFFQGPKGLGLTTALGILKACFVLVGNVPTTDNGSAVNGDPAQPSELVEFISEGQFVAQVPVDTGGQGGAFGVAITASEDAIRFAAVDDINNTLDVWTLAQQ